MARKHHVEKSKQTGTSRRGRAHGSGRATRAGLPKWAPWMLGGLVLVAAAAVLIFRPKQALPSEITAAQAYEKYQAGALFLDVRSLEEWNQGHIEKSVLIPLDELANRLGELPRDQDIVVVCRSGVRSKEGATILRQAGFTRVTCMTGGLQAWADAAYPASGGQ